MDKPSFLRNKLVIGGIVVIALLAFGWYLASLDGRIAIVASGVTSEITPTGTAFALGETSPASTEEAALPSETSNPTLLGEHLELCGSDICIVSADGASFPLGLFKDYQIYPGFGFSPDGSQIVFNACSLVEIQQNPAYVFCHDLFIANRNGEATRLTNIPNVPETHPSWSPDSEWVAFGGWSFSLIRADGVDFTELVSDTAIGNVFNSAWSADGRQIAFISGNYNFDIEWGFQNEVSVINRDGTGWRKIFVLSEPKASREDWITEIAWSPDGESIAIQFDDGRAYLLNPDCEAGANGCDLASLTPLTEIPREWLDTFHPQ